MPERFSFGSCPKCSAPLLVAQEFYGSDGNADVWSDVYRLYPPRDLADYRLPPKIRRSHQEAISCHKAKAHTAAAIMCRRTLEVACKDHGVKARTLEKALQSLKDQGIIERQLFDWADALRKAGNLAAHDAAATVSREDAADLLEFTNALLQYLYTFRDRFEAYKQRRSENA